MASNWNMAGESWDAAGRTSRNYRTRVRKMHGPVGVRPDPFFRGDARKYACTDCGHHKCSCADSAPPSAAQGEPASPTPGTFAWLKTLPPETLITRPCWETMSMTVRLLLDRGVGDNGDVWRGVSDWELA